jgi:predicted XRE-type DNA-binding protein
MECRIAVRKSCERDSQITSRTGLKKFKETGSLNDKARSGRPRIGEGTGNVIQEAFERSSQKSVQSASAELHIPQSTVHKILEVKLHEHAYKIQVVQMLQEDDYHVRIDFCQQIILNITGSYYIFEELTFSDEATSHIRGKFNGNRWDREKPRDVWQHERDSPKLNMWCALRKSCINGPFFLKDASQQ